MLAASRACWPQLIAISALNLLSIPLALIFPLPLKIAVDSLLHTSSLGTYNGLTLAVALTILTALLVNLIGLLSWWCNTKTGEKLVWDFRSQLLHHVQRLPMSYHDQRGIRDSGYRIQHDAPAIQYVTIQGIIPQFTACFTLLGMLIVSARIDAMLAGITLLVLPPLYMFSRAASHRVEHHSSEVKSLDSSAISVIHEVLGSIRLIKAFGQESRESERFVRHSDERIRSQVRLSLVQGTYNLLVGTVISIGTAAALFVGIRHVRSGVITVGELLIVIAYIAQIYEPLRMLTTKASEIQVGLVSLQRAFALLDEPAEISEIANAVPLHHCAGEIEFRNVSYRHHERQTGLHNISVKIPAGSRVGIIGPTGSGKTTLINLLMRFYDPQQGQVLLDGRDLRDYRIADLRRQFSIVPQEAALFATTVAENIGYGDPSATDEAIIEAAKAAHAHDFILGLPDGYQTDVGELGGRLSGGERQRLSLARAFLRNSPILVLDEPTSALDMQTEAAITSALDLLLEGHTTFIVAHRLSTLKICDLILMLDHGELLEVRSAEADSHTAAIFPEHQEAVLVPTS